MSRAELGQIKYLRSWKSRITNLGIQILVLINPELSSSCITRLLLSVLRREEEVILLTPENSGMAATAAARGGEMLSKEELLHLFSRFSSLISQPNVKRQIADAVKDKQEAVAVTTEIQEEILLEMGIDPRFGITCLGKVNTVYENDMELMIQFYQFVAKEEMAIDEAELNQYEFIQKTLAQQNLQNQQLEMLKYIRKYSLEDQSAILKFLHKQSEDVNFDPNVSMVLTPNEIQEIVETHK
ncbi:hypothetical protein LUZ60_007954 [Juncus effusus]|nr:hypothetical protein LUZ60_007954 [Juncus effusus]